MANPDRERHGRGYFWALVSALLVAILGFVFVDLTLGALREQTPDAVAFVVGVLAPWLLFVIVAGVSGYELYRHPTPPRRWLTLLVAAVLGAVLTSGLLVVLFIATVKA